LIMKYFSIRNLEEDVIEKLLQSIHIDEINKDSALNVLKTVIKLNVYEGVETFDKMKKKSIDVITENWTELTSDNDCRQEVFSLLPFFPSSLVVSIFDNVDSKAREERRGSVSQLAIMEKRCQERISEANRLRQGEVSRLKRDLDTQTKTMVALQIELDGRLFQVDRTVARPTASNGAVIPKPPSPMKTTRETAHESEGGWYYEGGVNDRYGNMDEMEGMEMVADVFIGAKASEKISEQEVVDHHNDNSNHQDTTSNNKKEESDEDTNSDQRSVSTANVQKKKGRTCW